MLMVTPSDEKRKVETGLAPGDAAKLARRFRVSITHVLRVARGGSGRANLVQAIERKRARHAAKRAQSAVKSTAA